MDLTSAVILGIVQGVSEFLPISSTGHMILASHLMGLEHTEFLKSFEIAIQAGTILSVVVLYGKTLLVDKEVIKRLIVAFLPTGIIGLTFYRLIKGYLLGSEAVVLWALLFGGVILIIFEWWYREKQGASDEIREMSYGSALVIGLFQSIAMIPGVSRSAATIVGGLLLGMKRKTIVEFTFLLAVPTMLAATGYDLVRSGSQFSAGELRYLLAGFVTAFMVALLSIKFLLRFIKTHTFIPFGVYRIVVVICWVLVLKR